MVRFLYFLISLLDDNWGYTTSIQKRFKVGDEVVIVYSSPTPVKSDLPVGCLCKIVETGRHDYLVEDQDGNMQVVLQFEVERPHIPNK